MEIQNLREMFLKCIGERDYAQVPSDNGITLEKIDLLKKQLRSSIQTVKNSTEFIKEYVLLLVEFNNILNKCENEIKFSQRQTIKDIMIDLDINYTKTNEENK